MKEIRKILFSIDLSIYLRFATISGEDIIKYLCKLEPQFLPNAEHYCLASTGRRPLSLLPSLKDHQCVISS